MSGLDGLGWPDERDLHAEAEDRELLEEHKAHPERFRRVGGASDDAAYYPSDAGWWWAEASDGSFIPVSVEKRGPRQVLSVCIPRCSTHCDKWWRPLKAIKGKWRGRVQLPLDNPQAQPPQVG